MFKKKHKRKVSRIIIFTTDAVDAKTKQFKVRPWMSVLLTLVFCILAGALIGYIVYEGEIWNRARLEEEGRLEEIAELEEEKASLEAKVEELNEKLEALSTAVNEQSRRTAGRTGSAESPHQLSTDRFRRYRGGDRGGSHGDLYRLGRYGGSLCQRDGSLCGRG